MTGGGVEATWEVRSHVAASLRALTLPRTVACGEQERRVAAVVGLIQRRALGSGRERGRGEQKVSEAVTLPLRSGHPKRRRRVTDSR